jgi:hypothetical protein
MLLFKICDLVILYYIFGHVCRDTRDRHQNRASYPTPDEIKCRGTPTSPSKVFYANPQVLCKIVYNVSSSFSFRYEIPQSSFSRSVHSNIENGCPSVLNTYLSNGIRSSSMNIRYRYFNLELNQRIRDPTTQQTR